MNTELKIRLAVISETEAVSSVLNEAAAWLRERGTPMWKGDELLPERIAADVAGGLIFVAEVAGEIVGTVKFQLEDELFWPDVPRAEAAYVHRLAVRRAFAGRGISTALLQWSADRARELGRRFLRLDCEASRTKLRALYERSGFRHHSDRQVGPYFVARYELELDRPTIRDFTAADDVVALTELLHRAYAIQAARGLRFLATHQTPDVTASRISTGRCLVLELGGRIVGTLTVYPPDPAAKTPCYREPGTFRFGMFGIEPDFRGRGYGRLLHDRALDCARASGGHFMALDTAATATDLITLYARWGYRVVDRVQWPETNYESVIMKRTL